MTTTYDRRVDDLGKIVALEHVNTTVPDQRAATLFYIAGLGFTRDPCMLIDPDSGAHLFDIEHEVRSLHHPMWGRCFVNRNAGQSQRDYVSGRDAYGG